MTSLNYKNALIATRIVLISVAVIVVVCLIRRDVVLSGNFSVSHDYLSPSPFFTELVPTQRVVVGDSVKINEEPIYTTLEFPRPFQSLDFNLTLNNPQDLFIEAGPQVSAIESYDLQGFNHPYLNHVLADAEQWSAVSEGDDGVTLYQKHSAEYTYPNLKEFNKSLPSIHTVGYYGVDWKVPYLPDFTNQSDSSAILTPLQGTHKFAIAVNSDALNFDFSFQDVNNQAGKDDVNIVLSNWNKEVVKELNISDDGYSNELAPTSELRKAEFDYIGLDFPAVYIVEIQVSDDIYIHDIQTSAPYIVALNRLNIAGGPEYIREFGAERLESAQLYTSARSWNAITNHRETVQDLQLAGESLKIDEPFTNYSYKFPRDKSFSLTQGYPIIVRKGNILLSGRGVFALNQEQFFNPTPWLIDNTFIPGDINLSYIVTTYQKPLLNEDGSFTQNMNIDLSEAFVPHQKLRFQISAPDIQSDSGLYLQGITADYHSEKVTLSNAWSKLKRFLSREMSN